MHCLSWGSQYLQLGGRLVPDIHLHSLWFSEYLDWTSLITFQSILGSHFDLFNGQIRSSFPWSHSFSIPAHFFIDWIHSSIHRVDSLSFQARSSILPINPSFIPCLWSDLLSFDWERPPTVQSLTKHVIEPARWYYWQILLCQSRH